MKSCDITVIMPAYNAGPYILQAIESIKKQSLGGEAQMIVIDDGSTDQTAAQLQENSSLTLLKKPNGGAASARNMGLRQKLRKYVYFLDADDLAQVDAFLTLGRSLEEDRDLGAVFGLAEDFISPELSEEQKKTLYPRLSAYSGILPGCSLIRSEVFEQIGMFDETLSSGEVIDWMLRLRNSGLKSISLPVVTLKRRLHMHNTGRLQREQERRNYAAILRRRLSK